MSAAFWQLDGHVAKLAIAEGEVSVDVTRPSLGLVWTAYGRSAPQPNGLKILKVAISDQKPLDAASVDVFVRGCDLVATYAESPPRHVRAQIYWRQLSPAEFAPTEASHVIGAFDLILSVNTSVLDDDPHSVVRSSIPSAGEILNVRCSEENLYRLAPVAELCRTVPDPSLFGGPTGCYLVRIVGASRSYVEMVHPADYQHSGATISESGSPGAKLSHSLFAQRLEKGVILRARVRAAMVEREGDETIALAAFQHFSASEPPLTV
jgi:hypothetical protein